VVLIEMLFGDCIELCIVFEIYDVQWIDCGKCSGWYC
jgi:hypothetical protein